MSQAHWVIQVLDDSNRRSIEYANRFFLRQNVEKMHIRVCVEDCAVSSSKIEYECGKDGVILIQEGKEVQSISDFNPEKEALLLVSCAKGGYYVFLYSPTKE